MKMAIIVLGLLVIVLAAAAVFALCKMVMYMIAFRTVLRILTANGVDLDDAVIDAAVAAELRDEQD